MSDLPLRGLKPGGGTQPKLVVQDAGDRITVRVSRQLRLPVAGDRPAVQFRRADLSGHVCRDFPVMIWADRAGQLRLHGLRRVESTVQPCVLPRELLVAFVDLVREENSLGLAVRAERDRPRCRALTPEPGEDAGSRCRTSDSGYTWITAGPVRAIVYENLYNVGWAAAAQHARDCPGARSRRQDNLCHYRLRSGLSSHAHPDRIRLLGARVRWQKVVVMTTIYVMTMTRTTVYLPLDAKRRLSAAAHRQHRSEAELIRDAVNRLLAEEPEGPRPNPPRFDLDPAVVDHVDEYLSAGFGTAGLEDGLWGA